MNKRSLGFTDRLPLDYGWREAASIYLRRLLVLLITASTIILLAVVVLLVEHLLG